MKNIVVSRKRPCIRQMTDLFSLRFPSATVIVIEWRLHLYKQNLLFRNLLLLSATSLATLTYLSSSQNFPRASDPNERTNPLLNVPFQSKENLIRSDERLALEKWASEALYGGLFTLSN